MTSEAEARISFVLRTVEERGIHFIRLWFVDVLGMLKSMAFPAAELPQAFLEGVGFDGSSIDGFARVQEADMLLRPDPETFQILPWRPETLVARMFCDVLTPEGSSFPGDPRQVLKRNLSRASELGYSFYAGPEVEFFLFASSRKPEPLDSGTYFDLTPLDIGSEFRRRVIAYLEAVGIPVKESHHEVAASQHEIDLQHADALATADAITTFRLAVKEVAQESGYYASFMPKPLASQWGSGMHTHFSLFQGSRNAFYESSNDTHLSKVGQAFVAGILRHAREITAITNPLVNSYKRLVPGFEAPTALTWGVRNRSALVRVPGTKPWKEEAARIEYRALDPSANPYLAFSVILAAGLEGIASGYELEPERLDDVNAMSELERREHGIASLPGDLHEALEEMATSSLVRTALGEHVFDWYLANKRAEWDEYRSFVSEWELERYLPRY
ncbi:MAG TPA: glutamine synthetase family protein [Actinomycetota bacterium]|nr:glutamine synthetase family protein [Actinomycetota bacterium]